MKSEFREDFAQPWAAMSRKKRIALKLGILAMLVYITREFWGILILLVGYLAGYYESVASAPLSETDGGRGGGSSQNARGETALGAGDTTAERRGSCRGHPCHCPGLCNHELSGVPSNERRLPAGSLRLLAMALILGKQEGRASQMLVSVRQGSPRRTPSGCHRPHCGCLPGAYGCRGQKTGGWLCAGRCR